MKYIEPTSWEQLKARMPKLFGNNIILWLIIFGFYWLSWTAFCGITLDIAGIIDNPNSSDPQQMQGVPISQPAIFALMNIVWLLLPYSLPERIYTYKKDKRDIPYLTWPFIVGYVLFVLVSMGLSGYFIYENFM